MQKRLRVLYTGSVQGVGFRFAAERLARHLPITGYVCNRSDGKVEIVAEGDETELRNFLKSVRNEMQHSIRNVDTDWSEPTNEFSKFGITF